MAKTRKCDFPGCERKYVAKGLCAMHYQQRAMGIALRPHKTVPRPLVPGTVAGILLVPLTPLGLGVFAIIDASDGEAVGRKNWNLLLAPKRSRTGYASTGWWLDDGKYTTKSLHRFLWELWGMPETPEIDHQNTNGLDCRRENLRAATLSHNRMNVRLRTDNPSGFKGVTWHPIRLQWRARISVDGKQHFLGYFDEASAASEAYREAAGRMHGEFARVE